MVFCNCYKVCNTGTHFVKFPNSLSVPLVCALFLSLLPRLHLFTNLFLLNYLIEMKTLIFMHASMPATLGGKRKVRRKESYGMKQLSMYIELGGAVKEKALKIII